jgi:DNA replication protein DnaC
VAFVFLLHAERKVCRRPYAGRAVPSLPLRRSHATADFLDTLLTEEVASKTAKHVTMRTHLARFPFVKSLDTFDFSYQPSLDKKQIQSPSGCHFIEHGENVVLLRQPGVGKSHLAVGLGLKAIEHGYRVLFATAAAPLQHRERRHYGTPRG